MGDKAGVGVLKVSFEGHSMFLANNLPVEVRDAGNSLVARELGSFSRSLPEGVYLVRATLPDGRPYEEAVAVRSGEAVRRVLGNPEPPLIGSVQIEGDEFEGRKQTVGAVTAKGIDGIFDLWATSPGDSAPSARLVALFGCRVHHDEGTSWSFVPDKDVRDTPYAVVLLDHDTLNPREVSVSLPLTPGAVFPENACLAAAVTDGRRSRVVVRFPRQRPVAAAVHGLLGSDSYLSATDLLENATRLLQDKYRDPPAAVLGALTLHRLGRLDERFSWVQNLVKSFPWLPDGRVLWAALLCRGEVCSEQDYALDLLLEAAGRRMMFTDGFALILDLLRRWPDDRRQGQREEAIDRLVTQIGGVEWDEVCLAMSHPAR